MKYIFIGASGFVGKYAMELAKQAGCDVLGTQSQKRTKELLTFNLLEHSLPDVLPKPFRDSDEPVYGIICASVRQIDQCYREREQTHEINVTKTCQLIDDLHLMGIRPVFLSTSYVFSGNTGYYTESDPRDPVCEYGRHKAEVEEWMQEHHPQALILRLDKIVGDSITDAHLFSEWWRWLEQDQPLTCIGGQIMSPTLMSDIGHAILRACEAELQGLYNTANMEFFSREELARQFLRIAGREAEVIVKDQSDFSFLDARPTKTYLDSSRFIKATGMPFTSMRECMTRFVASAATS